MNLLSLIKKILDFISPDMQRMLGNNLSFLEKAAKETANPWDDVIVALLRALLTRGQDDAEPK